MENQIRLKAFQWLAEQVKIHGEVLPRSILHKGFEFLGNRIVLIGPQGIFKPKLFKDTPISITTSPNGPYKDVFSKDGYLAYKYRGTDFKHRDNVGLRKAMLNQIPLIYFHGISPGKYLAIWPVYIVGDNPDKLTFTVAADSIESITTIIGKQDANMRVSDEVQLERKYVTGMVKRRVYQSVFREKVLQAYREQCAFCRLRHRVLLDAAHIIPDSDEDGEPVVNNGLSLCKIHHSAFDNFFIAVTPDYKIVVRKELLEEIDGPMLKYGIQEMNGNTIILPKNIIDRPNRESLERKYVEFKNFKNFI